MPYVELGNRLYVGSNYIDLGAPDGRIWEARFDLMPLSDGSNSTLLRSYLAACGLTLTRASSATVQTSASTVVTSGIGVDDPRVGDAGYGRGLVIEEARTNSCDTSNPSSWGVSFATQSNVTGPDGATSASRLNDTDAVNTGFAAKTISYTAATQYIASCWMLPEASSPANSTFSFNTNDNGPSVSVTRPTGLGAWARYVGATYVSGAGPSSNFSIVPAYAAAAHTGACSFALFQRENGKFSTEAIVTAGAAATRNADRVVVDATRLIRSGRIRVSLRVALKGSIGGSNDYSADPYLWRYDASNYATIDRTTGAVTVVIAGGSYTTASGLTASAGNVIDYWIEAGGGSASTVVQARKSTDNGVTFGAVTTLGTGAAQGTHPSATSMDLLSNAGSSGHLSAWVHRVTAYGAGRRPAWVA